ncbi:rho GTPase-activating protein 10-like [Leptonychotes weddellii]|uniref:Rho GTPase-activating protein 10-like n=1 Tax=Leptonychotes weddellii TaxID=9713 RepID=A0A7F8Q7D3_LEPWE|nr:rho GTPase-activating protein 10-like [Leptonychotes weddellii]
MSLLDLCWLSPCQTRSPMVQWLNTQSPTTPSCSPVVTPSSPKPPPSPLSLPAAIVDKPLESVVSRKARAVYPCEAEHSSELSFEIGAVFEDESPAKPPLCVRFARSELQKRTLVKKFWFIVPMPFFCFT